MDGAVSVICMICESPMTWNADDERWHCPIHNPIPQPTLYDWKQETDNA